MTIAKMELDGSIRLGKEEWIKIEYIVAGKILYHRMLLHFLLISFERKYNFWTV